MEPAQLKKHIFTLIEQNQDTKILEMVYTILEQHTQLQSPVWHGLEEAEKEVINQGISQLEKGESTSHEKVMEKIKTRFGL